MISPGNDRVTPAVMRRLFMNTNLSQPMGTNFRTAEITVKRFADGTSNPSYLVTVGDWPCVLRKQPTGELLPGAHNLQREYECLQALSEQGFPVPHPYYFCADRSYVGTPFYLMEYVDGVVLKDVALKQLTPAERRQVHRSLVETLAQLHSIDVEKSGLAKHKRSKPYFLRQTVTWMKQYEASVSVDMAPLEMKEVFNYLRDFFIKEGKCRKETLVHGDCKIDNVIFDPKTYRIRAVIDWELITVGDPLAELAYLTVPWIAPYGGRGLVASIGNDPIKDGIPTLEQILTMYESKIQACQSGPAVPELPAQLKVEHAIYGLFRTASIMRCISARVEKRFLIQRGMLNPDDPVPTDITSVPDEYYHWGECIAFANSAKALMDWYTHRSQAEHLKVLEAFPSKPQEVRAGILRERLRRFMREHIYPNEARYEHEAEAFVDGLVPVLEELKQKAKSEGLWNLFVPDTSGLTHYEYATMSEIMGYNLWAAEVFNCQFPDTGNMETLMKFANDWQKERWLKPLLEGEARSSFVMTEPRVASSDATNVETSIECINDTLVINGLKWWITGGADPRNNVFLILGRNGSGMDQLANEMARNAPSSSAHGQHSIVIVPKNTPGISLERECRIFGYMGENGGHWVVNLNNVRVPKEFLLGEVGAGFRMAQVRLGPGRMHHCMRTLGLAERAVEMMVNRTLTRDVFGGPMANQDNIKRQVAEARMALEQARGITLRAAEEMDRVGDKDSRQFISLVKVAVPRLVMKIIDDAIQVHGGAGVCQDTLLPQFYARTRSVCFMDGPDAVHLETVAKMEYRNQRAKGPSLGQYHFLQNHVLGPDTEGSGYGKPDRVRGKL
eukprot:Clim_evm18s247 gene=Clim_evmTU18s247